MILRFDTRFAVRNVVEMICKHNADCKAQDAGKNVHQGEENFWRIIRPNLKHSVSIHSLALNKEGTHATVRDPEGVQEEVQA